MTTGSGGGLSRFFLKGKRELKCWCRGEGENTGDDNEEVKRGVDITTHKTKTIYVL
jgi:hypothetical protein